MLKFLQNVKKHVRKLINQKENNNKKTRECMQCGNILRVEEDWESEV